MGYEYRTNLSKERNRFKAFGHKIYLPLRTKKGSLRTRLPFRYQKIPGYVLRIYRLMGSSLMSFLEMKASITLMIRAMIPTPVKRGPINGIHPKIKDTTQNAAQRTRKVTPFFTWPLINCPTPGRKMDTIPGSTKTPFLFFIKLLMVSNKGSVNGTLCFTEIQINCFAYSLGSMSLVCNASRAKLHSYTLVRSCFSTNRESASMPSASCRTVNWRMSLSLRRRWRSSRSGRS